LRPVPGRTTTTIVIGPGAATLGGSVVGPDGALDGATVRIERLVGDAVARVDTTTLPDGTWSAPGVLGGRYRVRAWRAPDLALTKPEVFFLEAKETKALTLKVVRYTGLGISFDVAPNPPVVGEAVSLELVVADRAVDGEGVVRSTPVERASVELFGSGQWRFPSSNPTITDSSGRASWELVCRSEGKQALSVMVADNATFVVDVPACIEPPPLTTTTAGGEVTTTTGISASTSTTRPASTTTTSRSGGTSTTRR
ncbi:MAG TPA: carboxypeptidase-like regulatory domain-containing protein, partial [Acidimicrobiales bacterium]|nr:carboxypeptidase-like regulatory domain-containing protein [Acidimicrobiales bacterium]